MIPVRFASVNDYFMSCTDKQTQIAAYDQIIRGLQSQAGALVLNGQPVTELTVNDGMSIIKGVYLTPTSIGNSIQTFIKLRNQIINQGDRVVRLINIQNFNG